MKKHLFNISVIIPNWNGASQLIKNLPFLFEAIKKFKGETELIIADDASTDDSIAVIKKLLKDCPCSHQLIINKKNLGFAGNVNNAVKFSKFDYLFLLNTDVQVIPGCFQNLLADFKNPQVFGVGANADWVLSVADFKNGFLDITRFDKISHQCRKAQNAFWISGGSSAFRRKIWFELGGLDNLFSPFYFEETDLCYRAWKRGYQILWEPKAKVIHRHQEGVILKHFDEKYIDFVAQRNRLFFIWKNIHDKKMIWTHYYNLMKRVIKKPSYIKVLAAALYQLPRILKNRRWEKKAMVVSDKAIFGKFKKESRINFFI